MGEFAVERRNDNPHRRGIDEQVEEVILLAKAQTLVLQLVHHAVEDAHQPVGFVLADRTETAAEILLTQQVHTIANDVHRLQNPAVEHHQIEQDKEDDSLQQKDIRRQRIPKDIEQHPAQEEQQEHQQEKQ